MTTLDDLRAQPDVLPPYSRAIRRGLGLCLLLGGLLNGGAQYLAELLSPDHDDFSEQIRWGADNPLLHEAEQIALVVSMLFLPLGLLGIAQVTRWHARRITAAATLLTVWGMWGFGNVIALGYAAGTVGPDAIGVDASVQLNDAYLESGGVMASALYPHLLGSFFGLLLLSWAAWRSRVFPKPPLVLLVAFLVWDFMLPSAGPLEPHLLLLIALTWLGIRLMTIDDRVWAGASR